MLSNNDDDKQDDKAALMEGDNKKEFSMANNPLLLMSCNTGVSMLDARRNGKAQQQMQNPGQY